MNRVYETDQSGFLLLGGPKDGLWAILPENVPDYFVSEVVREPIPNSPIPRITEVAALKRHRYRQEHIHFPDGNKVAFLVHETLTPSQAMVKLLKGYKP